MAEKLASGVRYDQQSNTLSGTTRQVLKSTSVPQNATKIPQDKMSHRYQVNNEIPQRPQRARLASDLRQPSTAVHGPPRCTDLHGTTGTGARCRDARGPTDEDRARRARGRGERVEEGGAERRQEPGEHPDALAARARLLSERRAESSSRQSHTVSDGRPSPIGPGPIELDPNPGRLDQRPRNV